MYSRPSTESAKLLIEAQQDLAYVYAKKFGGGSKNGGTGDSVNLIDLAAPGKNLFDNVAIKALPLGLYATELKQEHVSNFDGALDGIVTFPLAAIVSISNDGVEGERVVQWTVCDSTTFIHRRYSTLTSTGVNYTVVNEVALDRELALTYSDMENNFNRVGYPVGNVITAFTGTTVVGGPIATASPISALTLAFLATGEIVSNSDNPLIQTNLDLVKSYWLPYGAVATDYSIKYLVSSGDLKLPETTMSTNYVPVTATPQVLAIEATANGSKAANVTVTVKHVPTGKETMISFTLQVKGNYFN